MSSSERARAQRATVPRQRGVAALAITLIVLALAALITIGATRVGVGEQRSATSEVRSRIATALADMAVERGVAFLKQNIRLIRSTASGGWLVSGSERWAGCGATEVAVPCGDGTTALGTGWTAYRNVALSNIAGSGETIAGGTVALHYLARAVSPGSATPAAGAFQVIGVGTTDDAGATAVVRQSVLFYPLITHRPDAPLIAAGTIGLSGTISVVANPNGGGPGVPLSAWSGADLSQSGTVQTCHLAEFLSTSSTQSVRTDADGKTLSVCPSCECPNETNAPDSFQNETISRRAQGTTVEGIDILDDDGDVGQNPDTTNFPTDVFRYVFGVPETQWQTIRDQAQLVSGCDGLDSSSAGLIWVTGSCHISTEVGSFGAPVLLVIDNAEFRMNAGGALFGVAFAFAHDGGSVDARLNGGPTLYGSVISNRDIDLGNGNYTARYSREVLDNLVSGLGPASSLAMVPGSWRDY